MTEEERNMARAEDGRSVSLVMSGFVLAFMGLMAKPPFDLSSHIVVGTGAAAFVLFLLSAFLYDSAWHRTHEAVKGDCVRALVHAVAAFRLGLLLLLCAPGALLHAIFGMPGSVSLVTGVLLLGIWYRLAA